MNKKLLNILACPVCKGRLSHKASVLGSVFLKRGGSQLICEHDGLVFPVEDGIPMLNIHDAQKLDTVK